MAVSPARYPPFSKSRLNRSSTFCGQQQRLEVTLRGLYGVSVRTWEQKDIDVVRVVSQVGVDGEDEGLPAHKLILHAGREKQILFNDASAPFGANSQSLCFQVPAAPADRQLSPPKPWMPDCGLAPKVAGTLAN